MTKTLLIAACAAWIAQIILGALQLKRFNQAYTRLARENRYIGVGRSAGRFSPKVVIIAALNEQKIITDSLIMQGLTVFAKPKPLTQIHGMPYDGIDAVAVFPNQPRRQAALQQALSVTE